MSDAKKCNRCGTLFEPKSGDMVITDLLEHAGKRDGKSFQRSLYTESENECDLCTNCSRGLRNFLKPIQHGKAE